MAQVSHMSHRTSRGRWKTGRHARPPAARRPRDPAGPAAGPRRHGARRALAARAHRRPGGLPRRPRPRPRRTSTWRPSSPTRRRTRSGRAAVTRCRPPTGSRSRCAAAGCAPTARSWSTTTGRGWPRRGPGGCCATTGTPTSGCSTAAGPPGGEAGGAVETGGPRRCRATSSADPGRLPVLDADGAARVAARGRAARRAGAERFSGEEEPVDPVRRPRARGGEPADRREPPRRPVPAAGRAADGLRAPRRARPSSVAYCGSGVTATHDLFALHLLGREGALYAGSWSGWVSTRTPGRAVTKT